MEWCLFHSICLVIPHDCTSLHEDCINDGRYQSGKHYTSLCFVSNPPPPPPLTLSVGYSFDKDRLKLYDSRPNAVTNCASELKACAVLHQFSFSMSTTPPPPTYHNFSFNFIAFSRRPVKTIKKIYDDIK